MLQRSSCTGCGHASRWLRAQPLTLMRSLGDMLLRELWPKPVRWYQVGSLYHTATAWAQASCGRHGRQQSDRMTNCALASAATMCTIAPTCGSQKDTIEPAWALSCIFASTRWAHPLLTRLTDYGRWFSTVWTACPRRSCSSLDERQDDAEFAGQHYTR